MENPLFVKASTAFRAVLGRRQALARGNCSFLDEGKSIRITLTINVNGVTLNESQSLPYSWIDGYGSSDWAGPLVHRFARELAELM
jgi:hypothetical protein